MMSPFLTGAAIGALDAFSMLTAKQSIGVTTPFESTAALAAQKVAPDALAVNRYLAARDELPKIDGEWMLDVGIVLGSYLTSRRRKHRREPLSRYLRAFVGGALMMFGARAAKGCTSGHAISGTMQLAASSFAFAGVMSAAAAATTRMLPGGRR